jgi:transcriptional regulator with XRE-family HTH domain
VQLARLREWREARGLKQKELAAKAGVAEGTVVRAEKGDATYPNTARKMADALDVSVVDLMEAPPVPLGGAPQSGQPETGRHISVAISDSVPVSDDVRTIIFRHLDELEAALNAHGLNGELVDMIEQMREKVAA